MLRRLFGGLLVSSMVWLGYSTVLTVQDRPVRASSVLATKSVRFEVQPGLPDMNELLANVNYLRSQQGLTPLVADEKLAKVARQRANDMYERRYYAHKSPDGEYYYELIAKQQVEVGYNCENLELAFNTESTTYTTDWLASNRGHRECLLQPNVSGAGYAVAPFEAASYAGDPQTAFVIVAIHAEMTH